MQGQTLCLPDKIRVAIKVAPTVKKGIRYLCPSISNLPIG